MTKSSFTTGNNPNGAIIAVPHEFGIFKGRAADLPRQAMEVVAGSLGSQSLRAFTRQTRDSHRRAADSRGLSRGFHGARHEREFRVVPASVRMECPQSIVCR